MVLFSTGETMPSRVLREGILDSEAVNKLTAPEEIFYRRLMSVVDDFGRFDARTSVLRSRLYPLKIDSVKESDILKWMASCERVGLIELYSVDSKPYLLLKKLGSPRNMKSKYPGPEDRIENSDSQNALEYNRMQVNTGAPYSGSGSGTSSYSGAGCVSDSSEPPPAASEQMVPLEPPVLVFATVGSGDKSWNLVQSQIDEWACVFPGVDIIGECRRALAWCDANPSKRKTARGMTRFLYGWLERKQNSPRPAIGASGGPPRSAGYPTKGEAQAAFAYQMGLDAIPQIRSQE